MTMYLDNAATTFPKPVQVYQAVLNAMRDIGASPGRGGYRRSLEAGRILFEAREAAAALFSVADSSRIIFTHSATESLNIALRGTLVSGDHVITTSMEHNSLVRPLNCLRQQGVELTTVRSGIDGIVNPDDIRRSLKSNTRMIACGHVSNVSGSIQPIESIAAVAENADILFLLDAAQSAGSIPIDVAAIGVDLLAVPGHKGLYGPQGTGLLYAAPGVALKPLLAGGTGSDSTSVEQPESMPEGFESGTHNLPGIAGLKAGIEFVMGCGVTEIGRHESNLVTAVCDALSAVQGVKLHGPGNISNRAGLLSFTSASRDPSEIAFDLDYRFGIDVRSGLHCAPLAHQTIGTFPAGTVRMSPGWFSTLEDMAVFADAVRECLK